MPHFSPVPPEEREYAKNYRKELAPYEAQLVEVSGRVKEFRDHPERKDLQSLLLVNVQIRPVAKRKLIKLSHLWILTKHVKRAGVEPKSGRRIKFIGAVYAYLRLGGKSKQRGLLGSHDFSILPMEPPDLAGFEPGLNKRYENKDRATDKRTESSNKRNDDDVGKRAACGPKNTNSRRRNHGVSKQRSRGGSGQRLNDQHGKSSGTGISRQSGKANTDGGSKNSSN